MNIPIRKIVVMKTRGTDEIFVYTTLPCSFTKEGLPEQPDLELKFYATYDTGVDYVRRVFGMEPEVIDVR